MDLLSFFRRIRPATYVARPTIRKAAIAAALCLAAAWPAGGPTAAEPLRLVAIGDSLTHGYGLPQDQGFVPQLERWLRDQGEDVIVINMGVSGDTTEGGRARLGWALADGADAAIIALGGNDLLRGIDPARSRANLDAMLVEMAGKGLPVLLAGLEAPLNYGADYKAAFDGMYADLAEDHAALLYPSFVDGLVGTDMMQADGIHPNEKGVARMVEGIGPLVRDLLERARSDP